MTTVDLAYGKSKIAFDFDERQFEVLAKETDLAALSDVEINAALDEPIDSETLETTVEAGDSVLIVVPDATRRAASGQIVNLLVRRLIANGIAPFDIRITFATGIHRPVTEEEKRELLTPFIAQRIRTIEHNVRDLMRLAGLESKQFVDFGTTERGTPIELNRALVEHDKIILVGGVNFHYFAGFGGGRKLICLGLASEKTVNATHRLVFDCEQKTRRAGIEVGRLTGNPVHDEFLEIVEKINPSFAVNTIVDEAGNATRVFGGNWRTSHERACEFYAENFAIEIAEKRPLVVVSAGGAPLDLNLIQAHKALEMASHACSVGGTIVWLAESADGLGRSDFLDWFEAENSRKLAENLCRKFQVNGQTAWSVLEKAERFQIYLISDLPAETVKKMRLIPAQSLTQVFSQIAENPDGYVLPFGAKFLPTLKNAEARRA
ncbi:MAG: nickel-dependent lactate racemase [Acidobacteriota bacterium]|nr:nickel-dependent lactate racemase [Acidobacteriota bacterium]